MQKVELIKIIIFNIYNQIFIELIIKELSSGILKYHQNIRHANTMILETKQLSSKRGSLIKRLPLEARFFSVSDSGNGKDSTQAAAYADFIEKILEFTPSSSVLDLACGKALVSIELAKRGHKIVALDNCNDILLNAMEQALKQSVSLTLRLCSDAQFDYKSQMDFVLLRNSMFGICHNDQENEMILEGIAKSLKKGGRCLIEVYNKEFAMNHGVENKFFYDEATDRFLLKDEFKPSPADSIKLYSEMQWRKMLGLHQLKIKLLNGWSFESDPLPPPYRMNFIVAQKM